MAAKDNVRVKCISCNSKKLKENPVAFCADNDYEYALSFVPKKQNPLFIDYGKNLVPISDFIDGLDVIEYEAPMFYIGKDIAKYVCDTAKTFFQYAINTKPYTKGEFDRYVIDRCEGVMEDFSHSIFFDEILNMGILIIIDDDYKKFARDIEKAFHDSFINAPKLDKMALDDVTLKVSYAILHATVREMLDKNGVDWRAFPKEYKESGTTHDMLILDVEASLTKKFGDCSLKTSEFYKRASKIVSNMEPMELFELAYGDKRLTWRDYYHGDLDGNETDTMYINVEPTQYISREDIIGGKTNWREHICTPNACLTAHEQPFDEVAKTGKAFADSDELRKAISLLECQIGIDMSHVKKKYGIKTIKPISEAKKMPHQYHLSECSDKTLKSIIKHSRVHWVAGNKEFLEKTYSPIVLKSDYVSFSKF